MPRRSREEEEEEGRHPSMRVQRGGEQDGSGTSLFSQELKRQERAMVEQYNRFLRDEVRKYHPEDMPLDDDGTPNYHYFTLVAEYMRGMREVDLRFGGTVGFVHVYGSNDMYQQGLPKLVADEEQQIENFEPHQLGIVLKGVRQIAAGGTSTAALTEHGTPYTWGSSDNGT